MGKRRRRRRRQADALLSVDPRGTKATIGEGRTRLEFHTVAGGANHSALPLYVLIVVGSWVVPPRTSVPLLLEISARAGTGRGITRKGFPI
jgi:hypothetical protein